MDNNDLGLIKFSFDSFKLFYDKDDFELNENLIKKATDLINNYNCFISNYDAKSLWEKKKIMALKKNKNNSNQLNNHRNKPRVILIDFSDDMKCKKEFTSFLNKLTDVNKDIIYNKLKNFIKDITDDNIKNSLFDVLINFIKLSPNIIYIDVLYLFDLDFINNNINNYFSNFILNKDWIPQDIIIENKILYDNNNYDKYCLYVKLKKYSLSIIKALLIIFNKMNNLNDIIKLYSHISNDLFFYLNTEHFKHIIELLLDELIIIFDYYKDTDILIKLKNINLDNFDYSTKFKIMKILDNTK